MSARCPEGHESGSLDYCDICGAPMDAQPSPPAAAGAGSAAAAGEPEEGARDLGPEPQTCPHCGALNVADALFCEECGYDFTTGTPPMGSEPATEDAVTGEPTRQEPAEDPPAEQAEEAAPDPEPQDEPEEPAPAEEPPEAAPEPDPDESDEGDEEADDGQAEPEPTDEQPIVEEPTEEPVEVPASDEQPLEEEPSAEEVPAEEPAADDEPSAEEVPAEEPAADDEPTPDPPERAAARRPRHTPPSRALAQAWVVELWVDPDWYAVQQTAESLPSPGVPDIVLLTRNSALIGRPSGSLGARPEVDAGVDSAVSRRHAQLTSDGRRWWIEDLGSSNGTFVGTLGEELPSTPIPPGQRVELDRDDRVYVGAWTRLVLRPATESEQRGTG